MADVPVFDLQLTEAVANILAATEHPGLTATELTGPPAGKTRAGPGHEPEQAHPAAPHAPQRPPSESCGRIGASFRRAIPLAGPLLSVLSHTFRACVVRM